MVNISNCSIFEISQGTFYKCVFCGKLTDKIEELYSSGNGHLYCEDCFESKFKKVNGEYILIRAKNN